MDKSVIISFKWEFYKSQTKCPYYRATGVGKSFTMQCLGKRAIDLGYPTKYYRLSNLLEEIRTSRIAGTYTKTLAKISKFKLYL